MAQQRSAEVPDPCLVIGEVATLLADRDAVPAALSALVRGLRLRTAGVRTPTGSLAVGSAPEAGAPVFEVPVSGRSGALLGTLVVSGGAPGDLPALRSVAAVLGLALAPGQDDAEQELDDLADALHDGPVQSLVVARYASDAAARGGDVAAARDAVQAALVEARRFLWRVRPRGAAGLVDALDQLSTHLVEAGGRPLVVLGDVDAAAALRGSHGVLAFRLVQALSQGAPDVVRVALRTDNGSLSVDVDGGVELVTLERWQRRAQSLGGTLTSSAGRVRLVLPRPSDVRTSS